MLILSAVVLHKVITIPAILNPPSPPSPPPPYLVLEAREKGKIIKQIEICQDLDDLRKAEKWQDSEPDPDPFVKIVTDPQTMV